MENEDSIRIEMVPETQVAEEQDAPLSEHAPEHHPEHDPEHHRSHHHHSSQHHSSHHHKHKQKRHRSRASSQRRKNLLLAIGIPLGIWLIVLLFTMVPTFFQTLEYLLKPAGNSSTSTPSANVDASGEKQTLLVLSLFLEPQELSSELASAYMNTDGSTTINQVISQHYENTAFTRQDLPQTVTVNFALTGLPEGCTIRQIQVELSEATDITTTTQWEAVDNLSATFSNLKTNSTYYYQIHFTLSNQVSRTCSGSFSTAVGPRLLGIDGIANVRDIGGWSTTGGQTIQQGLLYRGSELDGATDPAYRLTTDGADTMLDLLGICYDLDLRANVSEAADTYILGTDVVHQNFPLETFGSGSTAVMGDIFRQLSKPDNYPMYLHCTDGTASTGTVCLILEALLGVSQEDLIRDYELSALYSGSVSREPMEEVLSLLQTYDGESLQQQAENYLLSCGLTQAELDTIRSIFLD